MATIDYIESWAERLRARLYTQFRDAVTWGQFADMLAAQFQDLEDAGQSLLTLLDIDNSVGTQLDGIGKIVGQARAGALDSAYRLYLKARVASNKSSGTAEDLYLVMRLLFGSTTARPSYKGGLVKQFELAVAPVLTRAQAIIAASFVGTAKEAAARGVFKWQESSDDLVFRFDSSWSLLSSSAGVGAATLTVADASPFQPSGTLYLGIGTTRYESIPYTSKTATTFTLTGVTAYSHLAGEQVQSTPAPAVRGGGFNVGAFTGALEATR